MSTKDSLITSSWIEWFGHWTMTGSLLFLFLTNCGLLFSSLQILQRIFGNSRISSSIHHSAGIVFSISLIISFFVWIRDCLPHAEDWAWLKGEGYFGRSWPPPSGGKFNTIQKLYFFGITIFGIMASSSGIILWNPYLFKRELVAWGHAFHCFSATYFAVTGIIHIYLRHFPASPRRKREKDY
jgi:formate dehydrogenase subunit gamma